jgi:osmotically-inducible protein OsmY
VSEGRARRTDASSAGARLPTTVPTRRNACRHGSLAIGLLALLIALGSCATAVDGLQDARIEAELKARLVAQKTANLTQLGVVSRQGIVVLTGIVESADQKALAETLARGVAGVRRVINGLELRSTPD